MSPRDGVPAEASPGSAVRSRPGGRSERIRIAVLDATLHQLVEHGYEALTIANVAREAGVAETTVYRRWPTPTDLVAAAVTHLAQAENPVPDTGTLEGDLRVLLAQITQMLRRPDVERILRAAAALDASNPAALQARNMFWQKRFGGASVIVEHAISRGELPTDISPDALIEFLVAPTYVRVLLLDRPLDNDLLSDSVTHTLTAFGATRPARKRRIRNDRR